MVSFSEMSRYRQQYQQAMYAYNRAKSTLDALESKLTTGGVEDVPALLDQIEDARAACAAAKEKYENFSYLYNTGQPKPEPGETGMRWYTTFGTSAQLPKR